MKLANVLEEDTPEYRLYEVLFVPVFFLLLPFTFGALIIGLLLGAGFLLGGMLGVMLAGFFALGMGIYHTVQYVRGK